MTKQTFMIVDNQPLFTESLTSILTHSFAAENILHFNNTQDAYVALTKNHIDMILVDTDLEQSSGFDLVKRAIARGYVGKVLFVSSKPYDSYSSVARSIGGQGYVTKSEQKSTIINAINNVLKGYTFFKVEKTTDLDDVNLSKRELSVLNYLTQGYSNKQISGLLSLSEKTISTYKSRILKKYNVPSIVHVLNSEQLLSQVSAA